MIMGGTTGWRGGVVKKHLDRWKAVGPPTIAPLLLRAPMLKEEVDYWTMFCNIFEQNMPLVSFDDIASVMSCGFDLTCYNNDNDNDNEISLFRHK